MLIIFQVIVPNLSSQEEKKENYPTTLPFPRGKTWIRKKPPVTVPPQNPGTPPTADRLTGLWKWPGGKGGLTAQIAPARPALFCIKFISTATMNEKKKLKYFSINKTIPVNSLIYSLLWQTQPKMTPNKSHPCRVPQVLTEFMICF